MDEWYPGRTRGADIVVFVGLRDTELDGELLSEIAAAPKIIWVERNIEQLARLLGWSDFQLHGPKSGWLSIAFRSFERPAFDWVNCIVTEPGKDAEIYSSLKNMSEEHPYAWRRDHVYYVSGVDFYAGSFMSAFVDFLHRAIPAAYVHDFAAKPKQVLLRVEDVSPLVRADALQRVIDSIERYNIPYAIGVVPVGIAGDTQIFMHENEALLAVLQRAQENGAAIVMHGYTHQNEYSPKTGEGWEFWNARDDKPMDDDEHFTRSRIEKSFMELARCGLYPLAFEPPHYSMSKKGLEILSEYFELYSGKYQISDKTDQVSMTVPYLIKSPYMNGMIVLPENMGYYDGGEFTVEAMLQNSKELLEIADPFGGFFYHGYLPPDHLPKVIEGVLKQGYAFFDIRSMNVRAGFERVRIETANGEIVSTIDPSLVQEWENEKGEGGTLVSRLVWVQIALLGTAIVLFVLLIVSLRRNARRKYEIQRQE